MLLCVSGEGVGGCRGRGDCAAFLVRALYKITNDLYNSELKSCVKVEVAVGLMAYGFCGRKAILQPTKFISCFLFCFLSAEHFGWQTAAPTSTPTKSTMLLGRHTSVITVLTCPSTKLWQSCCEQTVTVREFLIDKRALGSRRGWSAL